MEAAARTAASTRWSLVASRVDSTASRLKLQAAAQAPRPASQARRQPLAEQPVLHFAPEARPRACRWLPTAAALTGYTRRRDRQRPTARRTSSYGPPAR